jgi:hypothetical protein
MKRPSLGHCRVGDHRKNDHAVQWWYYWPYEDGWEFARGGTCRTTREARHHLDRCHQIRERERQRFLQRSEYELLTDGSLRPIRRSPYELVK